MNLLDRLPPDPGHVGFKAGMPSRASAALHFVKPDGRSGADAPALAIPVGVARRYNSAVVCCDGTWMAPSDAHVQTAGALEGEEMAQAPGGLLCRLPPGCQQWRRP